MRDPEPVQASWETVKCHGEITNNCCSKLLYFGVICYAVPITITVFLAYVLLGIFIMYS